eukprot:TRINITY_DN14384_c0_g1_i1.p1 TRINITY_DN14384_c0_g1~~TRINITY_DN14384_c0_g1_i1.p1  ORF type:complete len:447 (+),score=36.95 TRINITY_DN14384_c0_g1_i1:90-1343(+)
MESDAAEKAAGRGGNTHRSGSASPTAGVKRLLPDSCALNEEEEAMDAGGAAAAATLPGSASQKRIRHCRPPLQMRSHEEAAAAAGSGAATNANATVASAGVVSDSARCDTGAPAAATAGLFSPMRSPAVGAAGARRIGAAAAAAAPANDAMESDAAEKAAGRGGNTHRSGSASPTAGVKRLLPDSCALNEEEEAMDAGGAAAAATLPGSASQKRIRHCRPPLQMRSHEEAAAAAGSGAATNANATVASAGVVSDSARCDTGAPAAATAGLFSPMRSPAVGAAGARRIGAADAAAGAASGQFVLQEVSVEGTLFSPTPTRAGSSAGLTALGSPMSPFTARWLSPVRPQALSSLDMFRCSTPASLRKASLTRPRGVEGDGAGELGEPLGNVVGGGVGMGKPNTWAEPFSPATCLLREYR